MTIAELIANQFTSNGLPDGQVFVNSAGADLESVCLERCMPNGRLEHPTRTLTAYVFRDGSRLLVASDGWDLMNPKCVCGWCTVGERVCTCTPPLIRL